ncbi:MAG: hypothetical protein ACFCA4_15880 [Cyanophyceae cyanobacterium]
MTSSNPYLERAKQGDPDAIAYLMRRSLQSKGIEVSAQEEGDTLLVTLEGAQPVNREAVVAFIRKGMMELDISSLRSVQVDWRQQGSLLSEWTEEIPLNEGGGTNFGSAGLSGMDEPMNAPPPIDDGDLPGDEAMSLEDVYANEMADNDFGASNDFADSIDGDESMDDMQEEAPAPEKKKSSTSPIVLLLLLAAVLGGGWYFFQEGYFNPLIAMLPESIRQNIPTPAGAPDDGVATDPAADPAATDPAATEAGEGGEGTDPEASPEESPVAAESPASAAGDETPAAAESPAGEGDPVAEASPAPAASPSPAAAPQAAPSPAATTAPAEPSFNVGVRQAIKASQLAQTATTPAEWSAVAQAWQAAVNAMKEVPQTDANYATAQDRIPTYEKNLAYAQSLSQ